MSNIARIQHGQVSTTKSSKVSAEAMLEEAFESLSHRAVKAIGPTGQPMNIPVAWPHGQSPSESERTILTRIVRSIHGAMEVPATDVEIADELSLLFNSRAQPGQVDVVARSRAYADVLGDVPLVILRAALGNIRRGKADGIDKTFTPSTDVILGYCERLQRDVMAKAIMVERMLALPEMPAPREEDPAEAAANIERARSLLKPRRLEGEGA